MERWNLSYDFRKSYYKQERDRECRDLYASYAGQAQTCHCSDDTASTHREIWVAIPPKL